MNATPQNGPKFRIKLLSAPDEHGERGFIVEYDQRSITGSFTGDETAIVFGAPIPAEDHSELEGELALAVAFEGIVPFDAPEFQGVDAFAQRLVAVSR